MMTSESAKLIEFSKWVQVCNLIRGSHLMVHLQSIYVIIAGDLSTISGPSSLRDSVFSITHLVASLLLNQATDAALYSGDTLSSLATQLRQLVDNLNRRIESTLSVVTGICSNPDRQQLGRVFVHVARELVKSTTVVCEAIEYKYAAAEAKVVKTADPDPGADCADVTKTNAC